MPDARRASARTIPLGAWRELRVGDFAVHRVRSPAGPLTKAEREKARGAFLNEARRTEGFLRAHGYEERFMSLQVARRGDRSVPVIQRWPWDEGRWELVQFDGDRPGGECVTDHPSLRDALRAAVRDDDSVTPNRHVFCDDFPYVVGPLPEKKEQQVDIQE